MDPLKGQEVEVALHSPKEGFITFSIPERAPADKVVERLRLITRALGLGDEFSFRSKMGRVQVGRPRTSFRQSNCWTLLSGLKIMPIYGHQGPSRPEA